VLINELDQSNLSWREFERIVEDVVHEAVDDASWRVATQPKRNYVKSGGETIGLRLDVHVAERRQGGKGVVIDAKHFKVTPLNRHEIDSAEEYRRRCRASHALLAVSGETKVPESVKKYIDNHSRVGIMRVDESFLEHLTSLLESIAGTG